MKKNFGFYALIWAIFLAVFNLAVFLVRPVIPGFEIRYDARFWLSWAFILAAFIGNLACAYFAFKAKNRQKTFYRIPLIRLSYSALIAMLVFGVALMLIPDCPAWIAALVCLAVLAFHAVSLIKALWAVSAVEGIDEKIRTSTSFIKGITVDASCLISRARSDAVRAECKKVYEVIRYSDPTSSEALALTDSMIREKMDALADAVTSDNAEAAKEAADALVILTGDRNRVNKLTK